VPRRRGKHRPDGSLRHRALCRADPRRRSRERVRVAADASWVSPATSIRPARWPVTARSARPRARRRHRPSP
jgi:hypothetical protein